MLLGPTSLTPRPSGQIRCNRHHLNVVPQNKQNQPNQEPTDPPTQEEANPPGNQSLPVQGQESLSARQTDFDLSPQREMWEWSLLIELLMCELLTNSYLAVCFCCP